MAQYILFCSALNTPLVQIVPDNFAIVYKLMYFRVSLFDEYYTVIYFDKRSPISIGYTLNPEVLQQWQFISVVIF